MHAWCYPNLRLSASSFAAGSLEAAATIFWLRAKHFPSNAKLTSDKPAILDQFIPNIDLFRFMSGPDELKTETVRVVLPLPAAEKPPDQNIKETVRIQLPLREPLAKPPPFSTPLTASAMHAPESPSMGQTRNTQSTIMPNVAQQNSLIELAREKNPMLPLWILLGVSALILIIQIWTYFS
jgi:hypothetical protein